MGIRLLHRRKASARVHATATADTTADPDRTPTRRPLPALAPGAATPRVPGTPLTALRETAARLRRRTAPFLTRREGTRREDIRQEGTLGHGTRLHRTLRPLAERARGHLTLALAALRRPRRQRAGRRIAVFVASATPGATPGADRFGGR
ncbi:hypothetical protein AB0J81_33445 [Streptomyces bobili]|uniref:hypothetical protein n=1 Tax=Streptomyces bobili TaxID=67280 RepID=UPI003437025C